MANKSSTAKLKHRDSGDELTLQQHETDSPILPVAQLEKLHSFKPEAVDWVIERTEVEGNWRRDESHRINKFVFIHKIIGQVFAFLIGLGGIIGGSLVAIVGNPWTGGVIASLSLTGLAVVFVTGKKAK